MPRSILAQLVVALRDDASRNAKALAGNLKGLGDSASSFASKMNSAKWSKDFQRDAQRVRVSAQEMAAALGSNSLGWGSGFSKELLKLKPATREFAKIKDSWLDLQRTLNAPGTRRYGATVLEAQRAWRNQIITDMQIARAERARWREDMSRPASIARKGIRMGAAAVGVYGGVHGTGRVIRGTAIAGANDKRETFRQSISGLSAEEIARISASSDTLATKYPSVSRVDIRELARGARNLTGDVGKGLELLPDIIRARVAIQSATGGNGDGDLDQILKSADIAGLQDNPARFRAFLENYTKAVQVEGKQLSASDYLSFYRRAKMAGSGFSDDFIAGAAPSLMQELGGPGAGTALATYFQQMAGGRIKKETLGNQKKAGLRDKKGTLIDRKDFISDPFEWTQKHIAPLMEKSGVDMTSSESMIDFLIPLFSERNAAEVASKFILQADQIRRNRKMYKGAKGLGAAEEARKEDPFVAGAGAINSLANAAAALAAPALPMATAGLNTFTDAVNSLAVKMRDNPEVAKKASTVATSAAAGAGIVGSIRAAAALWQGGGIAGAIGGFLRGGARGGILGGAAGTAWLAIEAALAGKATADVVGQSATGKNYTPRDAASVFSLAEQLNGIQSQISGVKKRTHPSRADEPNPDLDRLEGDAQEVRNRISAGTSGMGDGLVKSLADGIVAGSQTAVQAMETLMESLRARARSGIQIPVTVSPDTKSTDPSVPARASGGSVAAGNLYRVNEFGEEFYQPTEDGRIIDPRRLKAGKGGASGVGSISIGGSTFHITGVSDPTAVGETVMQMLEQKIQEVAQAAFSDLGVELA
ncbi:MAG: hypothetical protein J0I42_12195 [Bosea sp.]|uniref:hypothetical protein n=1 Tax=Bosea sp. (in: a-proteobacteria) TaxID=1871050 RepID=UPI001AD33D32|nr:hypothetical protein [Bosea sp. (in: a-proteobacteria)]MBN9452700.1 hypothetical protein [Bosea sp. (in: a-proteobacteria)]